MAKIDALLQHMSGHGATRALLQAGAPATLETPAGTTQGQPLSGEQIQVMLDEIIPVEARQSLGDNGSADFTHTAPSGPFNIRANQVNGQWQLEIHPAAVPFAGATPPPAITEVTPAVVETATAETTPIVMETAPATTETAPGIDIAKRQPPSFDPSNSNAPPPSPNAYPPADGAVAGNTSGMGDASVLPAELQGFNWGALLGSWIWGIGNSVWLGLLGLIPCVGFFMRFYLGSKGNEMAWKSKRWESVQAFKSAQTTWAIIGVALIGVSLFGMLIMSAIMFPVFARARENARRASCQSNLKQISLAALQFSQDHNDKFPTGTTMAQWKPQLQPYVGEGGDKLFLCPSHEGTGESYEINPELSGVSLGDINNPAQAWMFSEPDHTLHLDGNNIAFADGHIKWFKSERAQDVVEGNGATP